MSVERQAVTYHNSLITFSNKVPTTYAERKLMLSNTDFADLLKSGASNGLTADGKGRFGLEQVKTWDKQNNAVGKKKSSSFGKTPARSGQGDETTVVKPDKYRDRAFERRKDVVTSEEAALEAVVSKLDAEQTKFLGGDVEHTHLVKGLDYALLRKIREKERAEADIDIEEEVVTSNSVVNVFDSKSQHSTGKIPLAKVKESFKECRTTTSMGENLKKYFLNPTEAKIDVPSLNKAVAETISRTAFDFDLSEDADQDIPTTLSKSKKDWSDGNDEQTLVSFILNKTLEHKLSLIFSKNLTTESQNERQLLKRKRKEFADNNNKGKESSNNSKKVVVPKGIVEDIFADVGKYVPVGSLDEKELEECSLKKMEEERSKMDIVIPSNVSAKGLFQNLLPSFPATIQIKKPNTETGEPNKSIMAPTLSKNDDDANPGINTACLFEDDDEDGDEDEDELEKVIQINSNKITSSKTKTKTNIFQSDIKSEMKNKDNMNKKKNENENDDDGDDNRNISRTDGDLMAPIRALLAAQQNKEKAAYERSEAAATASSDVRKSSKSSSGFSSLAMGADGKSKVHRDIFGVVGSSGSKGARAGDAMGHGAYDDYGGDNETYDSDHEDENEGKEGKDGSSLQKNKEESGFKKEIEKDQKSRDVGSYQKSEKKDYKKEKSKHKEGKEADGDSSGQWRKFNNDNKNTDKGISNNSMKQSAIRPRVENNRAARRAGASK